MIKGSTQIKMKYYEMIGEIVAQKNDELDAAIWSINDCTKELEENPDCEYLKDEIDMLEESKMLLEQLIKDLNSL